VVAALQPDVLVSSTMLRARVTAAEIARATGLPVRFEPLLHERKVGDMQGTPVQGEFGVWPDTLARWVAGDTAYAPPGMEPFDQIRDRVLPVWDRVTLENQGRTIAIVAHGIVIRVILLSVVEGYNAADWPRLGRIPNASISEVAGSGRAWRLVRAGFVPDEVRKADESAETDARIRGPGPANP
jgi:probable phosphoglycerate mutase